jgi:K+-transporting ATPase c subunit
MLLTLIFGGLYPTAILAIPKLLPNQANGSLVSRMGVVVCSRPIGQPSAPPEYFQPRPSDAGAGDDATQSDGTNLAPDDPKLIAAATRAADAYRHLNGLASGAPIPPRRNVEVTTVSVHSKRRGSQHPARRRHSMNIHVLKGKSLILGREKRDNIRLFR